VSRIFNIRVAWIALILTWLEPGSLKVVALAQPDALASWNAGAAKQAIFAFVAAVTKQGSPDFVSPAERIATFDNDGTLWCEQPMYVQFVFVLDRVKELAPKHPDWKNKQPFKAVLERDLKALSAHGEKGAAQLVAATHTGMSTDEFNRIATDWIASGRHPKFKRAYTDLVYQPMLELLAYLRANGFKTYIVTGGGQDFVRVYAEKVYGIPPEQVVGTAGVTKYGYDKDSKPFLMKEPKLLLNDNNAGKPESIHLMIGRRPYASFGNSTGDREMLEYTRARATARAWRCCCCTTMACVNTPTGRPKGCRTAKVGTFSQVLYDEAKKGGWVVISMKKDWKRVFAFEG
jgi:phosphoglycolate phosphatase-like HAD superfamily hydrolase